MKKSIIVINGIGGVGKDTLCELAAKHFKTMNISSIDPIKEIAARCGWQGGKDEKSRRFLSDLKHLCAEYNDFPTMWLMANYLTFLMSDDQFLFVHIREPEEIEKFVRATESKVHTLLVRGGKRFPQGTAPYGNDSDDCVENYNYEFYFDNDGTLEDAENNFVALLTKIISGNPIPDVQDAQKGND